MGKEFYESIVQHARFSSWHELVDNPNYVKTMYSKLYYDALAKITSSDSDNKFMMYLIIGISGGVVLIAAIVVVIICIKRRRNSEETGFIE